MGCTPQPSLNHLWLGLMCRKLNFWNQNEFRYFLCFENNYFLITVWRKMWVYYFKNILVKVFVYVTKNLNLMSVQVVFSSFILSLIINYMLDLLALEFMMIQLYLIHNTIIWLSINTPYISINMYSASIWNIPTDIHMLYMQMLIFSLITVGHLETEMRVGEDQVLSLIARVLKGGLSLVLD